jgi:hypothetical protein
MIKQGSSRKGTRRRQAIASIPRSDETESPPALEAADVVKLDLSTHGIIKEIARIEAPPAQEKIAASPRKGCHEAHWGKEIPSPLKRGTWMPFSLVILITVGSIAIFNHFANPEQNTRSPLFPVIEVITEEIDPASHVYPFEKNPHSAHAACLDIFRRYCAARQLADALPLVRHHAEIEDRLTRHWRPWPSPPQWQDSSLSISETQQTNGRGYLILSGINQNGKPFLAFFIAENDSFLLDWEATTQFSESRISTMALEPVGLPKLMRITLTPNPYYLIDTPESEFQSYKITSADAESPAWAYIRRDSPAHNMIQEATRASFDPNQPISAIRATVRMQSVKDPPRFFITEMLHKDWVMP